MLIQTFRAALAVLVLGVLVQANGPAQVPAAQAPPAFEPTAVIPLDKALTTGTLPNGLRYYVRQNARPEKRVMLQLAVKAGSVDETDAQQGLAHFLEHMGFNGTTRFKPGELIAALESTGARLGPHVNAQTGFDDTIYMFQLPTDKAGIVEKGMQALADFAGGMTLDPKEIDKERGVVIEEWRGGLGAGSRLRDQQIPVLFARSKYADRLPIGKPEILKTFPAAELRAFYTKWYRPDRMAVVAVGDMDPTALEALIRKEFAPLVKPATPAPARDYPMPLQSEVLVKMATDAEATQSSVSIVRKRPSGSHDKVSDYRRSLVASMAYEMLNERFDEISRKADAPFLNAGAYGGDLTPTVDTFTLAASVQDSGRED
jgi:zinc protease